MTEAEQKVDHQDIRESNLSLRRGIKSRRELYLRQSRWFTFFVTGIVLFEISGILVLLSLVTWWMQEQESGIFVRPVPISEVRQLLAEPYLAVVRVMPRRHSFRSDTASGRLPEITFTLEAGSFSFSELDAYLSHDSTWGRYMDGVIFWIDRRALALMSHGDLVTLCDMVKMNCRCKVGLAADGYDWPYLSW